MNAFKDEVMRELEDQRLQNQMHIAHYLEHPYHNTSPYPNASKYPHYPYPYGHPGYVQSRTSQSKSPVRESQGLTEIKETTGKQPENGKHTSIRPISPRRPKIKTVAPPAHKEWDGYLTSSTTQGIDQDRKDVLNRRSEYANELKMRSSPRRNKNVVE